MAKRGNQTKDKILQTALGLFEERGFERVTINEICKASGIGKPTFYYYFSSKDDLLKDYYEIPFSLDADSVAKILSAENHFERLWYSMLPMFRHVQEAGTDIARQLFVKNLSDDVGTFRAQPHMQSIIAMQVDLITRGQQDGEFRNSSDPKHLEMLIRQIMIGTSFSWCMTSGAFDLLAAMRCALEDLLDIPPAIRKGDYSSFDRWEEKYVSMHPQSSKQERN